MASWTCWSIASTARAPSLPKRFSNLARAVRAETHAAHGLQCFETCGRNAVLIVGWRGHWSANLIALLQ